MRRRNHRSRASTAGGLALGLRKEGSGGVVTPREVNSPSLVSRFERGAMLLLQGDQEHIGDPRSRP